MGRDAEEIFERAYQLHLEEGGEKISFDDFFEKIIADEEFAKYFDTLFERSKWLIIEERKNNQEFCYYSGLPSPLAYQELNKEKNENNE